MGTLGKAAGVSGAFVAAHPVVIETLLQSARSYVYTTAAPALLAQRCARVARARFATNQRGATRLHRERRALCATGCAGLPWRLLASPTAIQPLVVGGSDAAVALSRRL